MNGSNSRNSSEEENQKHSPKFGTENHQQSVCVLWQCIMPNMLPAQSAENLWDKRRKKNQIQTIYGESIITEHPKLGRVPEVQPPFLFGINQRSHLKRVVPDRIQ